MKREDALDDSFEGDDFRSSNEWRAERINYTS